MQTSMKMRKSMYTCDKCGHQVPEKKSLVRHTKIVHDGINFPCRQCDYMAKTKQREVLLNTKDQYMKESNILVGNATIKQLQREFLLST